MHRREATFAVNASPDALWRFIRDFDTLCSCIPGVERVHRVDARTVELTVKEKVGVVPLVVDLTARIVAENPPHSLHAVATAEHLTMEIDVALRGSASGSELTTLFQVSGQGPLKPIVDRLFERRATERTEQFGAALGERFGAGSPLAQPAPSQAKLEDAALGRIGRLRRWLGQRLRRPAGR